MNILGGLGGRVYVFKSKTIKSLYHTAFSFPEATCAQGTTLNRDKCQRLVDETGHRPCVKTPIGMLICTALEFKGCGIDEHDEQGNVDHHRKM